MIAVDPWPEDAARVEPIAKQAGISYPILLDGAAAATRYGLTAIPSLVYIDPEGRIAASDIQVGPQPPDIVEATVKELLAEKRA